MDKSRAIWIYTTMCKIRAFEEKAYKLFEENKLRGSVHLYTGEEASAATICSTLTDNDYITSTHRGHGHCIAKGAELDLDFAASVTSVPYHPGAVKYFAEKGITVTGK
jgi:pyruvate dehydrogenase E1 component alpha subunit